LFAHLLCNLFTRGLKREQTGNRKRPQISFNFVAKTKKPKYTPKTMVKAVGQALRRAAKDARKTARMYGTPIYVMRKGKIIAVKP
jgi:hypothetical protein